MEILVALMITGVLLLLIIASIRGSEEAFRAPLEAFAGTLQAGEVKTTRSAVGDQGWVVEGLLQGRLVRLVLRDGMLLYEVRVPGSMNAVFDKQHLTHLVDQGSEERGQAFGMRTALTHLFGHLGFHGLRIQAGWLRVQRSRFSYALGLRSLNGVFNALVAIAPLLDSKEVVVEILAMKARAWTGGGQGILCPYCRDDLDPTAAGVAACETCRTIHHAECLAEARGCTVFGCAGAPPRRVVA